MPQGTYDFPVVGAAPFQRDTLRQAAVRSCKPAGRQPCATTLIAWRMGDHLNPHVREPLRHIRTWMTLWGRATASQRVGLRKAWQVAQVRLLTRGINWDRSAGPLEGTVFLLMEIGWRPAAPDRWFIVMALAFAERVVQ